MSLANAKGDIEFVDEKPESIQAQKPNHIVQIDNFQVLGLDADDADFYINFGEERRKRVIHKVMSPNAKLIAIIS